MTASMLGRAMMALRIANYNKNILYFGIIISDFERYGMPVIRDLGSAVLGGLRRETTEIDG